MLGSFPNKMGLGGMSMHSRILDGTENSQRYRRGSTAYSQFSLLSELDSEKQSKFGSKFVKQDSSNNSNENKFDRNR